MDLEVVRQSSTNIMPEPSMPRPEPPPLAQRFMTTTQTPAAVLPDSTAKADKLPAKYFKDFIKLESDKILNDFAQSADKNADELAKAVSKAKRDAMAQGVYESPKGLSYGFPTPMPKLKPSDIKDAIEADKRVFGDIFNKRAQLPVQGGKLGINWDRQLRRFA